MILSICIPTYNRSNILAQTVNSVVQSIKYSGSNEIELLISDNASTDDTPKTIQDLKKTYPFIKSRRNQTNIIDENFFLVAQEAIGEYVWIFADDDYMELDAIEIVLSNLSKNYNSMVLNYSMWNNDFSVMIKELRYNYRFDNEYNDYNSVLKAFGVGLQFLSSIVFKREYFFCPRKFDYSKLHEYGNSFLYALYVSIYNEPSLKYIAKPIVKYRGFNSDLSEMNKWYKYFIIGNGIFLKLLKNEGYSLSSIRSTRKGIIRNYLTIDIVGRKCNGINTLILLKKIPIAYYSHLSFVFVSLPLILLPTFIFKVIYKIYQTIRK